MRSNELMKHSYHDADFTTVINSNVFSSFSNAGWSAKFRNNKNISAFYKNYCSEVNKNRRWRLPSWVDSVAGISSSKDSS